MCPLVQVLTPAFAEQRRINEGRQCLNVALLCRNGDFFSIAYQNSNVYHYPNPDRKARRRKADSDTPLSELLIVHEGRRQIAAQRLLRERPPGYQPCLFPPSFGPWSPFD